MKRISTLILFAALALSCKRQKPPYAKRVWLGPHGGCIETKEHPLTGTSACWGTIPHMGPANGIERRDFGGLTDIAFSETNTCFVRDKKEVACLSRETKERGWAVTGADVEVEASSTTVCAFSSDGLFCFDGEPFEPLRKAKVRALGLGAKHACVVFADGPGVVCRGAGDAGALATLDAIALAAGDAHTCAILANHSVKCWGKNDSGQLGDRTTNDSAVPVQVLGLDGVARITAGRAHTCALLGNGTVHCWGNNAHHQLANGETKNDGHPQMVLGILGVIDISAAADATCAILGKDGEVRCWGKNDEGQLGDDSRQEHTVPAPIKFH